jgi:exopolysaccharide biosynthesis protein
MQSLGIANGLNLDGGGSTTLILRGRVVNHPSDSTGERTVGNALLITRKR